MATYHFTPLPFRTQALYVLGEACLTLTIEFVLRPHRMTLDEVVGQGVVLALGFFFLQREVAYDLEVNERGIRKLVDGLVERSVSIEQIRYAKEGGWGHWRRLSISEYGPALAWLPFHRFVVPATISGYDEIKARVFSWIEHPRTIPSVGLS